nr:hypothetical protein [Tanacetum cinerariifolium]
MDAQRVVVLGVINSIHGSGFIIATLVGNIVVVFVLYSHELENNFRLSNVTYATVSSMAPISSLPLFMVCGDIDRCVTMSSLVQSTNFAAIVNASSHHSATPGLWLHSWRVFGITSIFAFLFSNVDGHSTLRKVERWQRARITRLSNLHRRTQTRIKDSGCTRHMSGNKDLWRATCPFHPSRIAYAQIYLYEFMVVCVLRALLSLMSLRRQGVKNEILRILAWQVTRLAAMADILLIFIRRLSDRGQCAFACGIAVKEWRRGRKALRADTLAKLKEEIPKLQQEKNTISTQDLIVKEKMESQSETIQTVSALKLPMLKTGDYDLWSMRMKQYLTHTDYALWEVIVNGDAPAAIAPVSDSVEATIPPKTTAEKIARRNELKEKSTLLFGGNKESKKMQKTILKQQYKNFIASRSEGLDKTYDKFQKLISQLEIHGEVISQEDANLKLLRSLPPAWNPHTLIMRNKSDLDTLSMDDLYNNLKVYEAEINGQSSSSLNSRNVAFVSSNNTISTNEAVNTAHSISTTSSHGQASTSTYVDDVMRGHFARECRAPRIQGDINGDNTRRVVPLENLANALVVTDGIGYNWSYQAEEGPTEFALIAFSSSGSSSSHTKVRDNSITELKNKLEESLKEKDDLKLKLKKDLSNKSDVFESAFDSSVNESEEDNNQVNDRYKAGEGYHAVPPPYTGNFMPLRPDLSFAGLDDSIFKSAISEPITSVHKTETSKVPVNAAKQSSLRAATSTSTARYVNTVANRPTINGTKPSLNVFHKSHSLVRRTFNQRTAPKHSDFKEKINTAGTKIVVSAVKRNRKNAVKSSACWVWRPKENVIDHISKDSGSYMLKRFNYVDLQGKLKSAMAWILKRNQLSYFVCMVKTVSDDVRIQALVDGKKVVVNEACIRRDLRLDDAEGTACLPNAAIFEALARIGVLSLEQTKTNQAAKIKKLKKKVKKLEGKKKKSTHGLIVSSDEKDQGRMNDQDLFRVHDLDGDEVFVDVTTAKNVEQDAMVAEKETLMEIKATKPMEKGVIIQEPSEFRTTSLSQPSQAKEKGKGIMVEPEKPLKKKDQIALDEEDDVQAIIDADRQLAEQIQAQKREQLSIKERSKVLAELIESRRKYFAAKKAKEIRNKAPTKAQQKSLICTYMKNMEGYKQKDFKGKSFDDIKKMFDKVYKRVNTFVDMNTEIVEESLKKTQAEVTKGSSKRAGEELEQESAKKQKLD